MMLSIIKNLLSSYYKTDDFYAYVLQVTQKFYLICTMGKNTLTKKPHKSTEGFQNIPQW